MMGDTLDNLENMIKFNKANNNNKYKSWKLNNQI